MKAGLLITGLALAASASAQIRHGHRHEHKKRDNVVYHTEVVTATAPNAVVYVDSNGKPISTSAPKNEAPPAYQAPAPAYTAPKVESPKPAAPAYTAPKAASPPSYGGGSGSGSGGQGITYSPYNTDHSCKTAEQVKSDLAQVKSYNFIRLYGSDCNQVANVIAACDAKLLVGVFDIAKLQEESATLISQAKGHWNRIDTISIGNELVNSGKASVDQVVAAINTARGIFKAAGFSGSIVTIDTFVALIANPALCQASDYAAANCHAFFDGGKTADQAGAFVKDQAQRVSQACGGKKTVITESGWPSQGTANGAAVPSKENQAAAVSSLKSSFSNNIYLFTAFNDLWKEDFSGSFGCEKYWGIL